MRIDIENQVESLDTIEAQISSASKPRAMSMNLLVIRKDEQVFRARLASGSLRSLDTQKLRAEIAGLHAPGNPPAIMMSMRGMDSLASGCLSAFAELSIDIERIGGSLVLSRTFPKKSPKFCEKPNSIVSSRPPRHARKPKNRRSRSRKNSPNPHSSVPLDPSASTNAHHIQIPQCVIGTPFAHQADPTTLILRRE